MPRFAANVTTMFREMEVPERFPAAAGAGFKAVEFLAPYAWRIDEVSAWLSANNLAMILLNTRPGDPVKGETGLAALKGREEDFREVFTEALDYATGLGAHLMHVMAGRDGGESELSEATFISNLKWAADQAREANVTLLLEPLNTQDVPGYLHTRSDHTAELIAAIERDNVRMQFDFYHMQVMEGNLAKGVDRHFDIIGHIQFSSVPGRHEPQYGEVNLPYLFDFLDEINYEGWVGCEYTAKGNTVAGLSWAEPYLGGGK